MSHFLEVNDLNVQYTSAGEVIHAVNGVTFSMEKGETLALVGETGAGKTTICKAILRILPDRAAKVNSGTIKLDGEDLMALTEKQMRKIRGSKIAMVFQDPMTALNPVMKIGNQISEAIYLHNDISKKEARKRAEDMLKMVDIDPGRYDEYPGQFSGGMKQRVVIAMTLACNPELVLADEPTSALDVTIQAQVMDMISNLRKQFQTSMILVTHDLGIVANEANAVAVVYAGEILEFGPKENVYDFPSHPYTQGLFGAIPDLDKDTRRLANIEGMPPDPSDLPKGCCFSARCPYAVEACSKVKPELQETADGHLVRCSRWNDLKRGD